MSEHDGVTLYSIRWSEVFPWLNILRSFRLAVSLRVLLLGAIGILLTLLGWSFFAWLFAGSNGPATSGGRSLGAVRPGR